MNNNYNEIDNLFFEYFENNKTVPNSITNGIEFAFYNKKSKYSIILLIKKIVITIIGFLTIAGGIVFAKDIESFIRNIFNASEGVDTAVSNNYIFQNPDQTYLESQNTKMRINNIVMDDFNLNIELVANFENGINVSNVEKISIPDMVITDENENIIFFSNIDCLKNYYYEKNISFNFEEIYNKSLTPSFTTFMHDSGGSTGFIVCNLMSSKKSFPKSKILKMNFKTILMEKEKETYNISGNWDLSISIPSQFYNREVEIYKLENCNDSRINKETVKAVVSKTGLKFNMEMNWGTFKEYSMEEKQKSITSTILIRNEYVRNSNGQIFYTSKSSDSDGGYGEKPDGTLVYWQTFNITTYDITDRLEIFLPTNEGREIRLELAK